jgi:hypothetical protein
MAKKKNNSIKVSESNTPKIVEKDEVPEMKPLTFFDKLVNGYVPYVIIFLMSIMLYANTFKHQFALDDDIVICKNEYVLQGMKGMPSIFSKDLFTSFYNQMNTTAQLSGGRYRPLSVASFALEQELIGKMELPDSITSINDDNSRRIATNQYLDSFLKTKWDENNNGVGDVGEDLNEDGIFNDKDTRVKGFQLRHVNNVLLYGLSVSMLFLFLSTVVFKRNKIAALIISLLFLAHPIHTEVVANVKSRDEILSMFFMILTLFLVHQLEKKANSMKYIVWSCITFLAALLSKEYGATLLLLIPLSLYLFSDKKLENSKYINLFIGLGLTFILYLMMRSQAGPLIAKNVLQEKEIMNSPYLLATESETLATKIFMLLKYAGLLLLPLSLCSDYGYNSIPYKDFSDPLVWISIFLVLAMAIGGFISLRKKSWLSFSIAFYLFNIALVTNFIFNVGATMGDRLVFHSSLGFCMLLGYAIYWVAQKINKPNFSILLVLPILALYSFKTIDRNNAWKNDITLALTDVKINPNSIALNGNASSRNLDLSDLPINKGNEKKFIQKSIFYGNKALQLHPEFVNGHLNIGLAFAKNNQYDSAKVHWDIAFKIYPSHPQKELYYNLLADTYYTQGYNFGAKQQWAEGKSYLQKAVECNPNNAKYWYDLGGFSYNSQDYVTAKKAWTKAFQLNPTDPNIQKVQGVLK